MPLSDEQIGKLNEMANNLQGTADELRNLGNIHDLKQAEKFWELQSRVKRLTDEFDEFCNSLLKRP